MGMGVSVAVRLWSANRELEKLIEMCGSPTSGSEDPDLEDGLTEDIGSDLDPFRVESADFVADGDTDDGEDGMDEDEAAEVIADGEIDVDVEKDIDMDDLPVLASSPMAAEVSIPSPSLIIPKSPTSLEDTLLAAAIADFRDIEHHFRETPSSHDDEPASKKVKLSPLPSAITSFQDITFGADDSTKSASGAEDDWEFIDEHNGSSSQLPYLAGCTALPTATLPAASPPPPPAAPIPASVQTLAPVPRHYADSGYESLDRLDRMQRRQARMIVCQ